MKHLKLKVCGMKFALNVAAVAGLKPDYLGFIFYQKSARFISDVSAELIRYVPKEIKTVGVFVDEELSKVEEKISLCDLKAIQLHGSESPEYCQAIKKKYSDIEIIKAFGIDESFDLSKLNPYLNVVDYFLFDTKTSAHGGSGKTFDWKILEKYTLDKSYFLSGGIDLVHVKALAEITDPRFYALDINSRFETEPGMKDVGKVGSFIKEMEKQSSSR